MARRVRMFYGFPSQPPTVGETIDHAIQELKTHHEITTNRVRFYPWPAIRSSGGNLAQTVINRIDSSQIFACDLTYPNHNVSFELGYAIGRFKRLFVSIDTSIESSTRHFRRNYFNLLGLGYSTYENHKQLARALLDEKPWRDMSISVLNQRYRQPFGRPEMPQLLYLSPPSATSSVVKTVEQIRGSEFGTTLIVDDPRDNPSPSLDWYAEQLATADGVIIHLLSSQHTQSREHNTKCSIIAGLASALNRPTLILAHAPFEPPIDYEHLLNVHESVKECELVVAKWLSGLVPNLQRRRPRRDTPALQSQLDLRNVLLGQHVAEHERDGLDSYFIETSPYYRALEGPTTILIGRRGTGKTATLYAIEASLKRSKLNHVTILNPVGYELEGLVRVLGEISNFSERGFLIESLWKYLIYSEIALSIEESINARPIYQDRTSAESDFLQYCNYNAQVLRLPFSSRLDKAVQSLQDISHITDTVTQRTRISELLHATSLRELRKHIGLVLEKYDSLSVLIDNLDGPWSPGSHVTQLSELIRGLLSVVQEIPRDLSRSGHGLKSVKSRVTVLLRSDIFAFVQPLMPEQDKLPTERIVWNDQSQLKRVLDERLLRDTPSHLTEDDVWDRLFPKSVVGISPIEFIIRTTLPRPRDVIFIVKSAINNAINRQHSKVQSDDLLAARESYSEFVFRSVLAEDDPQRLMLEPILYEFAGAPNVISISDIRRRMLVAGVKRDDEEWYIDLLCDIGFLGIGTRSGFRYSREEGERAMLRQMSRRIARDSGEPEVYEINPAFYQVLQIE